MRRLRVLIFVSVVILAGLAFAYAVRAPLASYFAEGWLASKGIPSSVHVDSLDFSQVSAHVTLGDGLVPDFNGRITAQFDWGGWTPAIRAARISNPYVIARFDDRTISIGALGKLIDTLKSPAPARPSTLDVMIDDAIIRVISQQGTIDVAADARTARGKLTSFDAAAKAGQLVANGIRLSLSRFTLRGRGDGNIFDLQGSLAGGVTRPGLSANRISVRFAAPALRLDPAVAGYGVRGVIAGQAVIGTVTVAMPRGGARARDVHIPFSGSVNGERLDLNGALTGTAMVNTNAAQALAERIPVFGTDASDVRALTAALASVAIAAPAIHIAYDAGSTRLSAKLPVTANSASGASLRLTNLAAAKTPATMQISGVLALAGGGLPGIALDVEPLSVGRAGSDASFRLNAKFNAQPYRGAELSVRGAMQTRNSGYRITLGDCAHVSLSAYLARGKPLLDSIHGNICQGDGALVRGGRRGWIFDARWNAAAGKMRASQTRFAQGVGSIQLNGSSHGLSSGRVTVRSIAIGDTAKSPRFARIGASGAIGLKNQNWSGVITLSAKGHKLGTVAVQHKMTTGQGRADIALRANFAEKGLQPADLSPLLAGVVQASGNVDFQGRIAWTRRSMTSGGTLGVSHLDCIAPMGPLQDTNARIAFASLSPLKTASRQMLRIGKIGWVVPATDVDLRFALDGTRLSLLSLTAGIAKGAASLDPAKMDLSQPFRIASVVHLKNVDLDALVQATNLSDRIKLEARASGEIPFSIGPDGIRLNEGTLTSDAPGYLSISRSLWSSGTSVETNDAIRDFAYQAMEHLALDRLDGVLTSLPEGRLGLKLHIRGRNAPKEPQPPTTVNLIDLLRGNAFNKPMPLPKDTPVDLTLDTSLNFDELLRAYGQLRNGASHR